ncbi:MAG: energy transducer TonB [Bacteroidaceae bacterium]|nr:energy transducer TonB [Bacteroidaceae bacterium]
MHQLIEEPEVVKSVHPSLDAEAVRLISSMPNWKPGIHRGKPVRTKYTLPVNFRLHSVETTLERPTWIFIDTMDKAASEQYVVMYEKGEATDHSTAESLESDIKDLFNGKRKFIQVPKSDENLKKVKEIIAKYPDKKVNWML